MSATTLALILLSSIGFLFSGGFSAYLLFLKKDRSYLHLLLGWLIMALSLRIGKSVFYNFTDLPVVIKNLGLAANLAIGPLLLLYGKVSFQQYGWQRKDLWHFLPAGVYILFSPVIPNEVGNEFWYVSYSFVIIQQLAYLIFAFRQIKNWKSSWKHGQQRGFLILCTAISFIWLIYLLIFIQLLPMYIFGALSYSVLVTVLIYFAVKEEFQFIQKTKYGQNRLSAQQAERYLAVLQDMLSKEQPYLNSNLNIQDIADQLDLSAKIISQVINEQLNLNFSAFMNTYRIEEAKKRLVAEEYQQLTIASIAYDCGFNSISSFNTTFKAMTKQTPSQFRKAFLKTRA